MIDAFNARLKARKLLRLLDDERAALLSGRLAALPALSAARDQLFQSLGQSGRANAKALAEYGQAIRNRAERNRRLLGAALEGMRSSSGLISQASGANLYGKRQTCARGYGPGRGRAPHLKHAANC